MLSSDIQSLMNDVLNLAFRIPVEILWPSSTRDSSVSNQRSRPETYGEAYELLLHGRNLLALGIHRPPMRIGGSNSRRAGAEAFSRCPGGSRYLSITCPSSSFPLRDGDCLFVLRPPSDASATDDPDAAEAETRGLSPKQRVQQLPDGYRFSRDALTSATASTPKFKSPRPSTVPAAAIGDPVTLEEEKCAIVDPKKDTSWKLDSGSTATRPLTTDVDDSRDSETIATAQTKDFLIEWTLGKLARTYLHRVDCSKLSESGDTALIHGGRPDGLRQRVLDAVERELALHSVSRSVSLIFEDERGGDKDSVRTSLRPFDIDTDKNHAPRKSGKSAAVRPARLMCSGCNQVLDYWGEGSLRGPLALGCGHVTCLDCLENSSSPLTSTRWWCPSCGAAVSAVLPMV